MGAAEAKPGECNFVGDAVRNVGAAHAAGMEAIGYANKPDKDTAMTEAGDVAIVTSMDDLAWAVMEGDGEPGAVRGTAVGAVPRAGRGRANVMVTDMATMVPALTSLGQVVRP